MCIYPQVIFYVFYQSVISFDCHSDQIRSGDVETNYGWCGTCSDNENEEPEHCKQNDAINLKSNRMKDLEELENLAALANGHDTFSFPSINKNWGYCSENCVSHNTDQEHSEVHNCFHQV